MRSYLKWSLGLFGSGSRPLLTGQKGRKNFPPSTGTYGRYRTYLSTWIRSFLLLGYTVGSKLVGSRAGRHFNCYRIRIPEWKINADLGGSGSETLAYTNPNCSAVGAGEAPGEVPRVCSLHPRSLSGLHATARPTSRGQRGKNTPRFIFWKKVKNLFLVSCSFTLASFALAVADPESVSSAKVAHQKKEKWRISCFEEVFPRAWRSTCRRNTLHFSNKNISF